MNYISDVDYYDELFQYMNDDDNKTDYYDFRFASNDNTGNVDDIVKDYTPLTNGQEGFLDGSVVQLFATDNVLQQVYYNETGGKMGSGQLLANVYNPNSSLNTNTKFLLVWSGYGGYNMYPMNGDKTTQLFLDINDGTINGLVNTNSDPTDYSRTNLPKGYEQLQRVFKISNLTTDSTNKLFANLTVSTTQYGNYPIYVKDGKVGGGNGNAATTLWVKFITLGTQAWQLLIQKDSRVSSFCCFSNNDMTPYNNFNDACSKSGFTADSANCNGVVPKACNLYIKEGYDNPNCKDWCRIHPKECYSSINDWCQKTENVNKGICACFNKGKFDKFKQDFTKNCTNCKISNFTAGCFYPACLESGMDKVANQGELCPPNTNIYQNCIQSLTNQQGGNISADKVVQLCQLNSGQADTEEPVKGGGGIPNGGTPSGTGIIGLGTPNGTGTPDSGTIAPSDTNTPSPSSDNSFQNFWSKYQLYIIIGIVVLVVLIIIAIFVSMKK